MLAVKSRMAESSGLPEVGEVPLQPERHIYIFPRHQFGKSKVVSCAFQGSWFNKWQWLHHESTTDLVFCHIYKTGKKKIGSSVKDSALIYNGFCTWKMQLDVLAVMRTLLL